MRNSMKEILEAIQRSFCILELQDDWDDEGALKVDPFIFNKAMIFIHLLASKVEDLACPSIMLCKDSSIDLHFKCGNGGMLVNVKKETASCYGISSDKKTEIQTSDLTFNDIVDFSKKFITKN